MIAHQLGRLNREDAGRLIAHLAGRKTLPQKVTQQILDRTDGVPLFLEELTKMILESGLLREERDGFVLDAPLPPMAVPATLQASLVARLDRLSPVKEVAQIAATIGREFALDMLAAVCARPERELQSALDQLVAAGLIFAPDAPPASTYVFKHALVQDAAYGTMLRSRRRQLHNRVGSTLEARFPEIAAAQPKSSRVTTPRPACRRRRSAIGSRPATLRERARPTSRRARTSSKASISCSGCRPDATATGRN